MMLSTRTNTHERVIWLHGRREEGRRNVARPRENACKKTAALSCADACAKRSARWHEVAPGLGQHVLAVLKIRAQLDRLRGIELPDEHHHSPRARGFDVVRIRLEDLAIRWRRDD